MIDRYRNQCPYFSPDRNFCSATMSSPPKGNLCKNPDWINCEHKEEAPRESSYRAPGIIEKITDRIGKTGALIICAVIGGIIGAIVGVINEDISIIIFIVIGVIVGIIKVLLSASSLDGALFGLADGAINGLSVGVIICGLRLMMESGSVFTLIFTPIFFAIIGAIIGTIFRAIRHRH